MLKYNFALNIYYWDETKGKQVLILYLIYIISSTCEKKLADPGGGLWLMRLNFPTPLELTFCNFEATGNFDKNKWSWNSILTYEKAMDGHVMKNYSLGWDSDKLSLEYSFHSPSPQNRHWFSAKERPVIPSRQMYNILKHTSIYTLCTNTAMMQLSINCSNIFG